MKLKIVLILIGVFWLNDVASQTLDAGPDQEIEIGEVVTLQGQGKIPLSKNLRCFLWTSDNPDEAIANNHLLTIKVKPQKTTVYTLSIIECEDNTIVDADKVTVFVDGINTFTLDCVYDVKDGPIQVDTIANHNGQTCSSGIIYNPKFLNTPLPKDSVTVTATCRNKTISASTILVNSNNKSSINITTNEDETCITGTFDKFSVNECIEFGAVAGAIEKIESLTKKGPSPCELSGPHISASGTITLGYLACLNEPKCYKLAVEASGGVSGNLGGIECGFPVYGIPYVAHIELVLNANGSYSVNIVGKTDCSNTKLCYNPNVALSIGGGIGVDVLIGFAKANLTLNSGISANGEFCIIIKDDFETEYCVNVELQPLTLQGYAHVGWGLIKRSVSYEILAGNENLFTYPKNCNQ